MSAAGFAALTGVVVGLARVTFDQWSAATGSGATGSGATGSGATAAGPAGPDQLLVLGAAATALLLAGWLILGTVAAVVAHLPGRVGSVAAWLAEHWAPALSRRVAAALVGAATMGSLAPADGIAAPTPPAATASTADGPGFTSTGPLITSGPASGQPSTADQSAQPGWVPSRPVVAPVASLRLLTSTPTKAISDGEVVVQRGDTLWDIARRQLGPKANDAEVARAWPRWYAANAKVIGADPGRLLPRQILMIPEPTSSPTPGADRQAHRCARAWSGRWPARAR